MEEQEVGKIVDYFAKIGVAAIEVTSGEINVGDTLLFKGHTTEFTQQVDSMQMEHESVETAKEGDSIGIKVSEKVRSHDKVYKVVE